ncbi:hypothetical protein [Liquorilactobacillus ghanensis]|uniref:hypothetical protein n=1 Tax=Liquorilactobacillus ghanensis TaxID=399370 RepID=UPI0039EB5C29
MKNDDLVEKIMRIGEDVSSIRTDIENIKLQNKEIKRQNERLSKLENKVAVHDSNFKLLWYLISGVLIFLCADILAPTIVNWLSK